MVRLDEKERKRERERERERENRTKTQLTVFAKTIRSIIDRLSSQNSDFVPAIPPDCQRVSTSSIDPLALFISLPDRSPVRSHEMRRKFRGRGIIDNRPSPPILSIHHALSCLERPGGSSKDVANGLTDK